MQYINIVMNQYYDAAIKGYHIIRNNSVISGGILIHLGNFRVKKMPFSIIGGYSEESGFEKIVF